jgi:hypothetical protein
MERMRMRMTDEGRELNILGSAGTRAARKKKQARKLIC